jgi:outer membrane protein assembly factor BamB
MNITHCLLALTLWIACAASVSAAWPAYRHDAQRSGIATEEIKLPLTEVWMHRSTVPSPAWPELPAKQDVYRRVANLGPTTTYDRAFHVVAANGTLYYGSSSDDTVRCLDAADGRVRWTFSTDGPVRLAPVVADGRVYVGSDDGCVYCLRAEDGALVWKYRGGPEDRRLPGNGRMMSLWPVRCGVVVDAGVVYFCAGLFPSQGNFLCAVSAKDGKELWKQPIEVVSQGYLLASASHLYVPTGRTAPVAFDRATGKQVAKLPGAGANRQAGGCFAVLADDTLLYSAGETAGIQAGSALSKDKVVFADGLRVVADKTINYILTRDRLIAMDRAHWLELSRLQAKSKKSPEDTARIAELGGTRRDYVKWETPVPDGCELVLAGKTIFVGEPDRVTGYDVADGGQAWRGNVQGKAYGLAVSDGRLYVSTDRGMIHCFQPGTPPPGGPLTFEFVEEAAKPSPFPQDAQAALYANAAQTAIQRAGVTKGYCLVLGSVTGRLAYEIATRSQFQVVGVEPDARRVAESRRKLAEAGLYGTRVTIHQGDAAKLPFQKCWANLIVSEETLLTGKPPASLAEVERVLRPSGGTAVLMAVGKLSVPGWKTERAGGLTVASLKRSALPGAGEWSHFYGDAGNTACSGDAMTAGAVDLQWFGRPGPRQMPDRHDKNVGPLYKNGRLFVSGDNYLVAADAYNGTILWERDVPHSVRLAAFKNCGNMAAADDCLYVASGSDCLALDAQTGETRRTFSVAASAEWGYVAAEGDLLLGSATRRGGAFRDQTMYTEVLLWRDSMPTVCSDSIFAHQRASGRRLWTYSPARGVVINATLALGGGRVYFVESTNPVTRSVADSRVKLSTLLGQGADLVALDIRTGKVLWRKPAELEAIEHILYLSYARGKLLVSGTRNALVEEKRRVRYDLAAFDAASGKRLWRNTQTPVPDHILQGPHGEQVQHPAIVGDVIYGTGFACNLSTGAAVDVWKWKKSNHCGTVSTSINCAFSRYDHPRMFDLKSGTHTVLDNAVRPGCWINIIPAGGLILVPEASAGCTCGYPIQTSIALIPR